MKKNNKNVTSCSVQKEKHLIGRPKIQHNVRIQPKIQQNVRILSEHEIEKGDNESKRPSKCKK
jgi:hypothetical protein